MKKMSILCAALYMMVLVGCQKSENAVASIAPKDDCGCNEERYKGNSDDGDVFHNATMKDGRTIQYKLIDGKKVMDGDILIDDSQLLNAETGVDGTISTVSSHVWPNKTVHYAWGAGLPQSAKDKFLAAAAHWKTQTGISLVLRTNQTNYIRVIQGSGCYSNIGRIGGAQDLSIASGCTTGNTIHEIGHAIGLWHEHTRSDRNTYVTVNTGNIQSGAAGNFSICSNCSANGTLDFGSVMMYGSFFFSSNGLPTITKKDGTTFNVQRTGLSTNDISIVKTKYP